VKPESTEEISEILKIANYMSFTVVPRGAGTGLCAAALPTEPSVVLSLERLNEIIDVDEDNFTVTCEAGVPLEKLFEELKGSSLFFPPHPGDEGAQIGGLVVENAGGARAVKYGVLRNFVRGLEVVLPTGEVVKMGGKVVKNNSGLSLMHLMIGSEGILGIVTEVTLRLYPESKEQVSLIVPYGDRHTALESVPAMLREGIVPMAVEYMERDLIDRSCEHLGQKWPGGSGEAFLYIIVTGNTKDNVYAQCEQINEVCENSGSKDMLIAERRRDQEKVLDIRSNIYTALEPDSADILDVTVPPAQIGELMDRVDDIAEKYETDIPAYGHVADGNLHPHLMKENGETPPYMEGIKEEIYDTAIKLGGVITGEHGIGKTRIRNLPQALDEVSISLMKRIKDVFDPNGILNPGTVVGSSD
jgi:glycolate oxidase